MPFPKLLLKRRLWIGVLCTALLCGVYFYVHFVKVRHHQCSVLPFYRLRNDFHTHTHTHTHTQKPPKDDVTPSPLPVFHWLPVANTTTLNACRNSQQGYFTVVDELGEHTPPPPFLFPPPPLTLLPPHSHWQCTAESLAPKSLYISRLFI